MEAQCDKGGQSASVDPPRYPGCICPEGVLLLLKFLFIFSIEYLWAVRFRYNE